MKQLGQEEPFGTGRILLVTGLVAGIFALWAFFFPPAAPPPQPPAPAPSASAAAPGAAPAPATAAPAVVAAPISPPAALAGEDRLDVVLENTDLRLVFDTRGAVLKAAVLSRYRERGASAPDDLVSPLAAAQQRYPLRIETGDGAFDDAVNGALFHVEQKEGANGLKTVEFSWSDGSGSAVTKTFSLPTDGYEVAFSATLLKGGKSEPQVPLVWGPGLGRLNRGQAKSNYYLQEYAALVKDGSFKKVTRQKVAEGAAPSVEALVGSIPWAGVVTNYFAVLFIPAQPVSGVKVTTFALSEELQKIHPAKSDISVTIPWSGSGRLFLGPKEYDRLKTMGGEFQRVLDWGSILGPICVVLLWGLRHLQGLVTNYGVAVILLTLIIKLLFYPLTQRSMVKMKEMGEQMKRLKPQIDRLKAKYKKMPKDMSTRSKMNEEMMALYQREGINPMAQMTGCLPMLLQMPIFFALFTLLPKAIELRGAAFFGWIHDLSVADPYYITPLIMGVTMVISTKMTMTTELEGPQKMMLWLMPVMFTWICLWAPAGLTLYWLTNNVLTMGQQYLINRKVKQRQEEAARGKKSTPKGPSRPS